MVQIVDSDFFSKLPAVKEDFHSVFVSNDLKVGPQDLLFVLKETAEELTIT